MDLTPSEEQQALVEVLHEFAEQEVRPAARACEEAGETSGAIRSALFQMGVTVGIPEEFGGQGALDALTAIMVAEELAWGDPGTAFSVLAPGVAASVIVRAATPAQQADILPGLAQGQGACLALAERDAGGDVFRMETRASEARASEGRRPEGRVTGLKYAVAGVEPGGALLVVAEGPSLWRLTGAATMVREDKLGLRSARTFKVGFEDARAERIGTDPQAVVRALLAAKLLHAGIALGLARAAGEYSAGYARERTAFGRPIGAFQGISFPIADRATDLDAARLLAWEAAWALDAGLPDAPRAVMAACGHAVAAALAASDDAVQILGGHGYMRDHPVEMWYRDAMTLAAFDTPWLIGDLYLARRYEVS